MIVALACIVATLIVLLIVVLFALSMYKRRCFTFESCLKPRYYRRVLVAIFVFAIILRLPYLFLFTSTDEAYFTYAAKIVSEGCPLYTCLYYDQPPNYPYLTSIIFRLFGVGVVQAKIAPFTFSLASMYLVYVISKEMLGEREGLFSAFAFGFTDGIVFFSSTANQYSGLVFFTLISVRMLQLGIRKNSLKYFVFSGGTFAIASMFRLFGPVGFVASCLVLAYNKRFKQRVD